SWIDKFPLVPETGFVLPPLLARDDLGDRSSRAIDFALSWIDKFPLVPETGFVLPPLLACDDLGTHSSRAIDFAINWINKFPDSSDAEFVLKRLFTHPSLQTTQRSLCVKIAVPHLKKLGADPEASHLLKSCLRDRGLDPESSKLLIRFGLDWIKANSQDKSADYIFNSLLQRRDLSNEEWKITADIALKWLQQHNANDNRDLSLAALLNRQKLLSKQNLEWVKNEAEQWLQNLPKNAHEPIKLMKALGKFNEQDQTRIDPQIAHKLTAAALGQIERPTQKELEKIIDSVTTLLETSRPAPAGFLLPGLLAIVHQLKQQHLWSKVIDLTKKIKKHPNFLPRNKKGLSCAIWLLVDQNAWPEELAKPVLEELGIDRPSPINRPERPAT
ncbi:hypothetical protein, partial [Chlorobaculum thiosulfatiphilum]|uniref:hypothetical protein n=1 Tax=Chlorobaculum thiosulfatiphilum TaxID=115852 RepID=UPI0014774C06